MEHVEFKRLGGRLFVIGRVPEMLGSEWVSQLHSAIAWDSVVHYLVFESHEDFRTRMAKTKSKALRVRVRALPNMRVQRTRSSASPPHSPLTRYPLGDA